MLEKVAFLDAVISGIVGILYLHNSLNNYNVGKQTLDANDIFTRE